MTLKHAHVHMALMIGLIAFPHDSVKFMAKRPERVTLERLVEVAHTSPHDVEYSTSRQFFALARKSANGKSNADVDSDDEVFQFGAAPIDVSSIQTGPSLHATMAEIAAKAIAFDSPEKDKSRAKKSPSKPGSAGRKGKSRAVPPPAQLPSVKTDSTVVGKMTNLSLNK